MSQNVRRNLIATITPAAGQDLTLEMTALPRITTASTGTIATLVGHGGTAPYSYSIASGTIPGGTVLDAVTGKINVTGALTQGTYTFVAQVDDSNANSFLHAFSITISTRLTATATQPPAITLNFNPPALSTNYQFVFAATGNVGPLTWAIVSGAAPAGLTIVGSGVNAGRLGTATTVTTVPNGGAAYTFTVRATDSTTLETLDIPVVLWVYAAQTGSWNDYKNISAGVWAYPFATTLPPVEQGRTRTYRFTTVRGRGQPPFTWTWGGHASLTPFVTLTPVNGTLDCDVTIYGDSSLVNAGYFVSLHCVGGGNRSMDFPGTTGYTPTNQSIYVLQAQPAILPQLNGADVGAQYAPFKINFAGAGVASVTNVGGTWTVTIPKAAADANASANSFWAGPVSGGAAAPGFRAITIADLPATLQRILSAQGNATPPGGDTVANTVTATAFATNYTIATTDLKAGLLIDVLAQGSYGTAAAAPTLTLQLRLSNTNLLTIGPVTLPASTPNTSSWRFEGQIFVPTIGASVACRANGKAVFGQGATSVAGFVVLPQSTALSIATNATKLVQVFVTWGTANASNTITLHQLDVEAKG